MDDSIKKSVANIPLLSKNGGPRDQREIWNQRLEEEYMALIKYVEVNKESGTDWFQVDSNEEGTKWFGKCWTVYNYLKYEFRLEFEIPPTYPNVAPELKLPELEGKTAKMYRGGIICTTDHFKPLWSKNVPRFGIAHALALGLAPWLAVEIPSLVEAKLLIHKDDL